MATDGRNSDDVDKPKISDSDPIQTYTMSHFAAAIIGDESFLYNVLQRANAPQFPLMIIQESSCRLRESTFKAIITPYDVCELVFSGEGLDGDWTVDRQKETLENQGIDPETFPWLSKGEHIGTDCEGRLQFGDIDAVEFCQKYGITDEEWYAIENSIAGESSTDNVFLELDE